MSAEFSGENAAPSRIFCAEPTGSDFSIKNAARSSRTCAESTYEEKRAALRRDIRATLMPGFSGFTVPEWVTEAFERGLISVCVYGENVRDEAQIRALGTALRESCPTALLAIDEEGGEVTRLHYLSGSPYPGSAVLGRIDDTDYTSRVGERVGRDLLSAGFNLALGPVADVNSNPRNPVIGTRSFAADPARAGRHVAAWILGLQHTSAVACAKHFPGHGDTSEDSHLTLPTNDVPLRTLAQRELPPFRAAIEAGVSAIMTSHILLPHLDPYQPATFSRCILQGLLREELEFDGVIISDALDMRGASHEIGIPEAAVRALIAGCHLLCLGTNTGAKLLQEIEEAVVIAIDSGRLGENRLSEAAHRVRALASASSPPNGGVSQAEDSVTAGVGAGAEIGAGSGQEAGSEAQVVEELARIVRSFNGLDGARKWLAAYPQASVIRVESETNMAVGVAPWGPFAAARSPLPGTEFLAQKFAARPNRTVRGNESTNQKSSFVQRDTFGDISDTDASTQGVIVVGRELHRMPGVGAEILALRTNGTPVLIIEMGWPGVRDADGMDFAQLDCYGSSRLIGAAVLQLLEGGRP